MEQNPFADGPWGNCTCGWPRFRDGSCSNGECPDGGGFLDDDITEEAPDER